MESYHAARYPFLYCSTTEEERCIRFYREKISKEIHFFRWDIVEGFRTIQNPNGDKKEWVWYNVAINGFADYLETGEISSINLQIPAPPNAEKVQDPVVAFNVLKLMPVSSIIFMHDFHEFFEKVEVVRSAINIKEQLIKSEQMVVFLSAKQFIPFALSNDIKPIEFDMPNTKELKNILRIMCKDNNIDVPEDSETVVKSMLGLTEEGAKNAIGYSLAEKAEIENKIILNEKASKLNSSSILTYITPKETSEHIAGNEKVLKWLKDTINDPLSMAVATYGVPGCGKTLAGKVIANEMNLACLFANLNGVRGQYQGDAEKRLSEMFKIVNAMGNPFVILDEFDKCISGSGSGDLDSGVGQRIVQTFLIEWDKREEKKIKPFYYLTLNNLDDFVQVTGGALVRRMDIIFFVDLPSQKEAEDIAKIWSKQYEVKIPNGYDFTGFSGADIAKLARNMAMLNCDVDKARKYLIPSNEAIGKQISKIRSKAKSICVWASEEQQEELQHVTAMRKVNKGWKTKPSLGEFA